MKKISGNKLLVKALREEQVDTIFGYPGACTIDISDELYNMRQMLMQYQPEKQECVWLQADRGQRIL